MLRSLVRARKMPWLNLTRRQISQYEPDKQQFIGGGLCRGNVSCVGIKEEPPSELLEVSALSTLASGSFIDR